MPIAARKAASQLQQLLAPPRQPYTGPFCDHDPIGRGSLRAGQINPDVSNEINMTHGRYLSGLGNIEEMQASNTDPNPTTTAELAALEEMDDVYGSGIFDDTMRDGTANVDTGIFETHNSLPGYLARERWFEVSPEVSSSTGAAVVIVPAGGLSYVEEGGNLVNYPQRAPAAKRPHYSPALAPGRATVYAHLDKQLGTTYAGDVAPSGQESIAQHVRTGARDPANAFVWNDEPLPGHVRAKNYQRTEMVPSKRPPQPVPYQVQQQPVPQVSIVEATQSPIPVGSKAIIGYEVPVTSTMEPKGIQVVVPPMPSKQLGPAPKSSALGQDSSSSTVSLIAWGAVGAMAGVALSMLLK